MLDPLICKLCGDLKPDQKQVKKDVVFKSLQTNLTNCYTVTLVDESQIVS